jgi:pimeloyl-ACP methyl ester carboxylesterase
MTFCLERYILNTAESWFDHPRDLLHMVNHFRASMPRPMVGIGHSMGGANLVQLSLMHPRLLETVILIDPIIRTDMGEVKYSPAFASARRRDLWPSRKVAAESFKKSGFYKPWDSRVMERWIKYGLRDLPTAIYPDVKTDLEEKEVTLTTTKLHEVFSFGKEIVVPEHDSEFTKEEWQTLHEMMDPDYDPSLGLTTGPVSRPEPPVIFNNLKYLRPSALWVFGGNSPMSPENEMREKVAITGSAFGGSGGESKGRSKRVVIKDTGHLVPMEKVEDTADAIYTWLDSELERWRMREQLFARYWATVPPQDKHSLGKGFETRLKTLIAKI